MEEKHVRRRIILFNKRQAETAIIAAAFLEKNANRKACCETVA